MPREKGKEWNHVKILSSGSSTTSVECKYCCKQFSVSSTTRIREHFDKSSKNVSICRNAPGDIFQAISELIDIKVSSSNKRKASSVLDRVPRKKPDIKTFAGESPITKSCKTDVTAESSLLIPIKIEPTQFKDSFYQHSENSLLPVSSSSCLSGIDPEMKETNSFDVIELEIRKQNDSTELIFQNQASKPDNSIHYVLATSSKPLSNYPFDDNQLFLKEMELRKLKIKHEMELHELKMKHKMELRELKIKHETLQREAIIKYWSHWSVCFLEE